MTSEVMSIAHRDVRPVPASVRKYLSRLEPDEHGSSHNFVRPYDPWHFSPDEDWYPDEYLSVEVVHHSEPQITAIKRLEETVAEQSRSLQRCLEMLKDICDMLADVTNCYGTSVTSLPIQGTELPLRLSLTVILQEDTDEIIARLPEFNSAGYGRTANEAIADLKSQLGTLFEELIEVPEEELGILPKRWKQGLQHLVMTNG